MLLRKIQESNVTSLMLDFKSIKPDLDFLSFEMTKVKSLHLTCTGEIRFHPNLDKNTDVQICEPYTEFVIPRGQATLREGTGLVASKSVETVLKRAWCSVRFTL